MRSRPSRLLRREVLVRSRPSRLLRMRAVLLDALGTLVELQPPGPRLRKRLLELTGVDVGLEAAERGFAAEIEHYLANHMQGGTPQGLERLRDDCAAVMHEALATPGLERPAVRRAMLDALEFRAFDDVAPALRDLRARGMRLVVASNWDLSLSEWLDRAGLLELVDGAVSSAEAGASKPDPAVFEAALSIAGVPASEALHVGDSIDKDIQGARAAGITAVLIDRSEAAAPEGMRGVRSLGELPYLV